MEKSCPTAVRRGHLPSLSTSIITGVLRERCGRGEVAINRGRYRSAAAVASTSIITGAYRTVGWRVFDVDRH